MTGTVIVGAGHGDSQLAVKKVDASGESANRNKAATAARTFARPIGGMSEANCREIGKTVGLEKRQQHRKISGLA